MTSTNYSANGFSAALKKNLKRYSVGAIVAIAISLLVSLFAVSYLISFMGYAYVQTDSPYEMTNETLAVLAFSTFICAVYSLFSVPRLFNEIYSKRACDFYFSAPIKRSTYFNVNMLFGAVVNAIILVVPTLLFMLFWKIQPLYNVEIQYKFIFPAMAAFLVAVLASFSLLIMCSVCSGKKIQYVVLTFISIGSTLFVISGILNCINSIWGMSADSIVFPALNPLLNVFAIYFNNESIKNIAVLAVISVIELAITYTVGFVLFKTRKAEVAELSISGKIMPYVFLSVAVAGAFLYFSIIADFLAVTITGIVFAIIVTLIFSLIFFRKPFTKQTGITCAAVCAVCICLLFTVYFPKYSSYVSYMPEEDEIESVQVANPYLMSYYQLPVITLFERVVDLDPAEEQYITFESESGISSIRELHQKIIDDKTIKASRIKITDLYSYIFGYDYFESYNVRLVYNLKNGKTVTRTYSVNAPYVYTEFINAFKTEEAVSQLEPFKLNKDDILFMDIEYNMYDSENDVYETNTVQLDSYDELFALMLKDRLNESEPDFIRDCYKFGMSYYPDRDDIYIEEYYPETEEYNYEYYSLTIYAIAPDASQESRNKIEKMSTAEIIEDSWQNDDILENYCYVSDYNEESMEYLSKLMNK